MTVLKTSSSQNTVIICCFNSTMFKKFFIVVYNVVQWVTAVRINGKCYLDQGQGFYIHERSQKWINWNMHVGSS